MKKGFTLIELLAVIILLAVIAIIATPKIMDSIDASKMGTFQTSVEGLYNAVNQDYTASGLWGNSTYTYENRKLMKTMENNVVINPTIEIKLEGKIPDGRGTITVDGEGHILIEIESKDWCGLNTLEDKTIQVIAGKCPT